MFTADTIAALRSRVEAAAGIALPYAVHVTSGPGLSVRLEDGAAHIAAEDKSALARGFFRLCRCVREGRKTLDIRESRRFPACGAMADVSRNAVLKPEAVRRYIDQLASLGLNLLMLYTEDTYEVPGHPYMGYLRGRYTKQELRDIDAYAESMGVELVPCIQTLGHMAQYLQWDEAAPLRDQWDILLIDSEETYAFIEAQIRSMRDCMHTSRIHIGMDEAHGVGFGNYFLRHGATDRFELLRRHLDRVVAICERYGFRPIMWSDMFFRLGSKTNDYYDPEAVVPQEIIDRLPAVDLCYWDYYHKDEAFFNGMLAGHQRMGRETVFAGGIWTWGGFLPHVKQTEASMRPALRACLARGVKTVFATLWGDDGAETNLFLASSMLPMFSEVCWQGETEDLEREIALSGECLTGLPDEALHAMGEFFADGDRGIAGKHLVWGDILLPLLYDEGDPFGEAQRRMRGALPVLRQHEERLDCRYAARLMELCARKAELMGSLRARYLAADRAYLAAVANEAIPALLSLYDELLGLHRRLWERDMRRFGWEVIALRYGAATGRLRDVQDELARYLSGELETIEELDAAPLPAARTDRRFRSLITSTVDY
ncbi:MAG: family 20 glycosylhydrolase [Clostridia bacterium]|nr:family 20 glycosylhydrolase [Clostridia bacterium]